jgi:hypothetical protein
MTWPTVLPDTYTLEDGTTVPRRLYRRFLAGTIGWAELQQAAETGR